MRFKKIGAALLACAMCFGVFSTTAFAYVDESVATEEPAVEEKVPETEPEEPMLPLTPDGNLTLVDDAGSPTKSGKQFITAVTKNGNYFYIIIDRDDKGEETVHFLNQVDEADLLKLMDEEEVAEFTKPVEETKPEVVETVPEITEPTPEEKPKSTNMLPAILTLIVLACGGGFFVFKKVQEKKKAQEAAKPDPDADYVDDDEDYGYDPEFEDDDEDSSVDEDDNEPVSLFQFAQLILPYRAKNPLLRPFYAFAAKPCPPHSAAQSFQQNSCCFAVCTKRRASALENLPKFSHSSEFYNLALLYFAVV